MNMLVSENWDMTRMVRLEELYRQGLSFSLIAADIGVSRNAAIGKAKRMELPKRGQPIERRPIHRRLAPQAPRKRAAAVRPFEVEIEAVPEGDFACTIYDLNDCTCRYPLWSAATGHHERLYCGVPDACVSKFVPYCRRHTRAIAPKG